MTTNQKTQGQLHSERLKKKYAAGWSPRKGKQHSDATKSKMSQDRMGREAPKSAFQKGYTPWNKGSVGLMKPNKTSFSEGDNADEKHCKWEGDDVGYSALHKWIGRKKGYPSKCEYCKFTSDNGRQFHWANLSGEYLRDVDDFARLCVTCHKLMDCGNKDILNAVVKVR